MKLLALETATEACSVAVWLDGEVFERFEIAPRRHTDLALPWADELLARAGVKKSQLDAIACGRGSVPRAHSVVPARLIAVQHPIHIPPSAPARLVVLASGTGSLLQSLLSAAVGDYPARVAAVGVDRDCRAVEIAQAASIPTFCVRLKDHPSRADWDTAIADATEAHRPDLIVSAGFMKLPSQMPRRAARASASCAA